MATSDQNQQIIVEHIVNIDTVAQHVDTVDAVAGMAVQITALAGMLPDVAATVQMRATLLAVAKKLTEIRAVADALPLLAALEPLVPQVAVVIGMKPELAAVTGQMDAIRRLSAELETLLLAPEHAAQAEAAAERALTASSVAEAEAGSAEKSRLGAEFAENEAKAAANVSVTASKKAEASASEARQAADAAAAVSGLPDASTAAPGDPLIWNGSVFAVGTLTETLQSVDGALGVAPAVLESISTAQTTADGATSAAEQAATDAASAKATAEGVDGKATQAAADAVAAMAEAGAAGTLAGSFDTRLTAAETETLHVGTALSGHAGTADIHTPKADITALAEAAANRLKDGGDGSTLPAARDTLLKLSGIIDTVGGSLADFLGGTEPGKRMAMLAELDRLAAELSGLGTDGLTRADVVNALDSDAQDVPLAAAQGPVLTQMIDGVRGQAEAAARPWVKEVSVVPETWPEEMQWGGLLLRYAVENGKAVNPEWYANSRGTPVQLVVDATGIRLADGTTVQSGVASTLTAAQTAQTAATAAQSAATEAKTDAAAAKTTAEGVDGKATQAQADAAAAKADAASALSTAQGIEAKADSAIAKATEAKTTAEGVDAKATQALADAAEAKATAEGVDAKATAAQTSAAEAKTIAEAAATTANLAAPLHSAALTGTPTAPTVEDAGDVSQQIATTEFVQNAIANSALTQAEAVIGVCLVQEGGGAGTWARINEQGEIITVTGDYFNHHAIYSNIRTVLIDGQYMQQHNKLWVKTGILVQGALSGKRAWWISPEAREGFVVHPAFMKNGIPQDNMWIGTYQATDEGNTKIGSQPGKLPIVGQNFTSLKTRCTNRNTGGVQGFCMWNIHMLSLVQLLYLIEYLSGDSQMVIGQGKESGPILTTNAAEVAQATWRGHVGLWGNIWQMVDGFRINTSKHIELFSSIDSGTYVDTGVTYGLNATGQYVKSLYYDTGTLFDLALSFLPKNLVSTANLATFPDKVDFNTGIDTFVCHAGGPTGNGDGCGLFCLSTYYNAGFSYPNTGTRIAKL